MTIYEVFSHSIRQKYKTNLCSRATVFYLFITLLTFIPPLLIAYRSQGFWLKLAFYREQPEIYFKHKVILVLESRVSDKPIVWTSYPNLNELLIDGVKSRIPSIEHAEEDIDRDGRNDDLKMTIEVPTGGEEIVSLKLILVFDYKLHLYSSFQMECLAYIHYNSPLPGASVNVIGDLSLHQKTALWHRGKDKRFNVPVIDESRNDFSPYRFENIFTSYSKRNVTTVFQPAYYLWQTARGYKGPFTISLTINYPEETIQYRVGFWQLVKWAWIQYLAVLIVFWFICYKIKRHVFQRHIVPTIIYSPLKQEI